ncbi:hypothetical protein M408DRAFT_334245 [Serendipita vermifera MAFF 305830]|uniref:Uncharacterized protein n=1 Tax=Serendipita vermifera MAFF 305830 TaxID=933852 RepID=A0A0C3A580_SERVB|nr:hypothetical protein M408DRAFT_334245 [Serendipita vermifera MAFF 305830]
MDKALSVPLAYIVGGATLVSFATPAAIAMVGFTTAGVAAGSMAAGIQAGIGNVAAGSVFAFMQSLGTAPLANAAVGAVAGATGGGVTSFVHEDIARVIAKIAPSLITAPSEPIGGTRFILDQIHTTSLAVYRTSLPIIKAIKSGSSITGAAVKGAIVGRSEPTTSIAQKRNKVWKMAQEKIPWLKF